MQSRYVLLKDDKGNKNIELVEKSKKIIPASNASIQKLQCAVLIKAIDNYLYWREHQSAPDSRGFSAGWFTRFRHFTATGANRANQLKTILTEIPWSVLVSLKEHFQKKSTINNHSLDTYLLESIYANKHLFLQWFPPYTTWSSLEKLNPRKRNRLRRAITNYAVTAEAIYDLGKLYESEKNIGDHLQIACNYYAIVLQHSQASAVNSLSASLTALNQLAEAGVSEAQYVLGFVYYQKRGEFDKAIIYCMRAAERQHIKANEYLLGTQFSAYHYLMIAKRYERGEGVLVNKFRAARFCAKAYPLDRQATVNYLLSLNQPNLDFMLNILQENNSDLVYQVAEDYLMIAKKYETGDGVTADTAKAISFYHKACELGNPAAALYLGQFYQIDHDIIPKNMELAFQFYLKAAKARHPDALAPLDRLGEEMSAENQLALSHLYGSFFNNSAKAAYWHAKGREVDLIVVSQDRSENLGAVLA